jgi:tRNA(fMet)-specific endonuclease VapC
MYLLDTNACIALINGRPEQVRQRFLETTTQGKTIAVSSVVAFELWYGVGKSTRQKMNAERLEAFFSGPIDPLTFENEDAQVAGMIRAHLETRGIPIGAYDLLIAGQAVRHQGILVTANVSEFSRVPGLTWEDWAQTP